MLSSLVCCLSLLGTSDLDLRTVIANNAPEVWQARNRVKAQFLLVVIRPGMSKKTASQLIGSEYYWYHKSGPWPGCEYRGYFALGIDISFDLDEKVDHIKACKPVLIPGL